MALKNSQDYFSMPCKIAIMKSRPLYTTIWQELSAEKAMIFLSGPRQSGKTTLAGANPTLQ
jgi:predicted AAA+ superfamily ATPase